MSRYVVTPKNERWSNWRDLAEKAQIIVPKEQQTLGEELLLRNALPEAGERLLTLNASFSPSYPAERLHGTFPYLVPPHPIVMLCMLASLDDEQLLSWTFRELVSSYLLADNEGKLYYFYHHCDWEGHSKRTISFHPVEKDVYRCMYAWEYEKGAPFRYNEDKMAHRLTPA